MDEMPDFAGTCRSLQYCVSQGASCRSDFRERLELTVTALLGTSTEVNPGAKYVVTGSYRLTGEDAVSLGAAVAGTSRGHSVDLAPGSGDFVVWIEVLKTRCGPGRDIGLIVGTTEDRECGDVHTGIRITERSCS